MITHNTPNVISGTLSMKNDWKDLTIILKCNKVPKLTAINNVVNMCAYECVCVCVCVRENLLGSDGASDVSNNDYRLSDGLLLILVRNHSHIQ